MDMNVWDVYPEGPLGSSLWQRRKEVLQSRGGNWTTMEWRVWIYRAGLALCHCLHSVEGTMSSYSTWQPVLMTDELSLGRERGHDAGGGGGAASSKVVSCRLCAGSTRLLGEWILSWMRTLEAHLLLLLLFLFARTVGKKIWPWAEPQLLRMRRPSRVDRSRELVGGKVWRGAGHPASSTVALIAAFKVLSVEMAILYHLSQIKLGAPSSKMFCSLCKQILLCK